jgi:hypothetical protein
MDFWRGDSVAEDYVRGFLLFLSELSLFGNYSVGGRILVDLLKGSSLSLEQQAIYIYQ